MNMKKTIAAVAACAMAVSAMATTVSAVAEGATEKKSVHYDLTYKTKATTADLTFTLLDTGLSAGAEKIELYIPYSAAESISKEVTVTAAGRTFVFNTDNGNANYDGSATIADKSVLGVVKDAGGNVLQKDYLDPTWGGSAPATGTYSDDYVNDMWVYTIDLTTGNGKALAKLLTTLPTGQGNSIVVTMKGLTETGSQGDLNKALVAGGTVVSRATYKKGAISCHDGSLSFNGRGVVTESEVKKPLKTDTNVNSYSFFGAKDIMSMLEQPGFKANAKDENATTKTGYKNVSAVLNDMIANYDDVVFTFNTAADKVLDAAWLADKLSWIGSPANYVDYYVTGVPGADASWMGSSAYLSFPQHLYNLFGDENTGYTYSDGYAFNNLFNAALITNNGFTMNQSTVTPFEYSKTSVSFSWSDLTGGNSFVTSAAALNTLQLVTSSTWYWDSMDVVGYELAADDASSDAGADDDSTDLDEDTDADADDDATIDEGDDDADVDADDDADVDADADADADAADDTAADETTDANPGTGNAPIALAVIPVALAAAAVVAKKRG